MPPRVSILLPTHNRADVVALAVQSVLDQTETDFELLIVADGCIDGTVGVLAGFKDPRIRIFDLPKAAYFGYANRNIALREARGEFVAFAAHDDLLFPDHLARLTGALEASGAEWIYSRPLWVSTDGAIVPFATNLTIRDELEYFFTVANSIPASCVLFRRSCLEHYGYWPEDVPSAADWRHWIAIIEGGQRKNLAYLPTPTCLHFSAVWKHSRHSAVEEVRSWLEVADASGWWPAVLRWPVPPGLAEQEVIFAAMRKGGDVWVRDVRTAVDTVLDRLAWDDLRVVRPRLRQGELENQQLGAQVTDLSAQVSHLGGQITHLGGQINHLVDELASLHGTVATYKVLAESRAARIDAAEQELQAFRHQLSLTLASTSWRITAPMRTLKQLLGRR